MRILAGLGAVALVVAACGDEDTAGTTTAAGSPAAAEIAVRPDTAAGTVLVDADGMTLYTTERRTAGSYVGRWLGRRRKKIGAISDKASKSHLTRSTLSRSFPDAPSTERE